jgi:hypothetical protein
MSTLSRMLTYPIMLSITISTCKEQSKTKIISFIITNIIRNDTLLVQNYYTTGDTLLYQVALNDTFYPNIPNGFSDSILSCDLLTKYIEYFEDTNDRRPVYPKIIRQKQRHEFVMRQLKTTPFMQYYMTDSSNTLSKLHWYYQPTKTSKLLIICSVSSYGVHLYDLFATSGQRFTLIGSIRNFTRWQTEDTLLFYPDLDFFQSQDDYWGSGMGGNIGALYKVEKGIITQISENLPINGGCNFPFDSVNFAWGNFDCRIISDKNKKLSLEIIYDLELTDTYKDSEPVTILNNSKKQLTLKKADGLYSMGETDMWFGAESLLPYFRSELLHIKKTGNKQQRQLLRLYN